MTNWLDDDQRGEWGNFILGSTHLIARLEAEMQHVADLSHLDYGILAWLSDAEGGAERMSVLATLFGVDPSVITYRVRRLSGRGLVERRSCPEDGRGVNAVLTEAGQALLVEVAPAHVALVRREFIDLLSAAELRAIGTAFVKIRAHQLEE